MKKYFILFFIIITSMSASELFDKICKKTILSENQSLIAVYFQPATCVKCYIEPLMLIDKVSYEVDKDKFKIVGLVRCDRDIEMKVFKKQIKWTHQLYRDNGNARKELGATSDAILSVFSSNGTKSLHIRSGNNKDNVGSIVNFINNN